MIAHLAGLPAEELLPLVWGGGAMLAAARAWAGTRARRARGK